MTEEAKARELYEKIFPELKKQREEKESEDKERDHRHGSTGAVRSEAEDKKMHSCAVIPRMLLPYKERQRKFTSNKGLILDPLQEFNNRYIPVLPDSKI